MTSIYIIRRSLSSYYAEGFHVRGQAPSVPELCPLCNIPIALKNISPINLELTNTRLPDCLYTYGLETPFVLSQRSIDLFLSNGITGIEGYSKIEKLTYKNNEIEALYYRPEIKRIKLPIDNDRSRIKYGEVEPEHICPLCDPTGRSKDFIFGLYFNLSEYDDTDIFKTYEFGNTVFFSQKLADIVKRSKLSNFCYQQTSKYNDRLKNVLGSAKLIEMFGTDTI